MPLKTCGNCNSSNLYIGSDRIDSETLIILYLKGVIDTLTIIENPVVEDKEIRSPMKNQN